MLNAWLIWEKSKRTNSMGQNWSVPYQLDRYTQVVRNRIGQNRIGNDPIRLVNNFILGMKDTPSTSATDESVSTVSGIVNIAYLNEKPGVYITHLPSSERLIWESTILVYLLTKEIYPRIYPSTYTSRSIIYTLSKINFITQIVTCQFSNKNSQRDIYTFVSTTTVLVICILLTC